MIDPLRFVLSGSLFLCIVLGQVPTVSQGSEKVSEYFGVKVIQRTVTATVYHAEGKQTDKHPFITADGTDVRKSKDRILSVSHNLLKRGGGCLSYGDSVLISGTGVYDGYWVVRDTMSKRFKNRVDFLVSKKSKHNKWRKISLCKVGY